jgi:hypothetical protein
VDESNALLSRIEAAGMWAYFHKDWLLEIRKLLRPQLPPEYHVFVEPETILVTPDEPPVSTLPDLSVATATPPARTTRQPASIEVTAATIELDEPCEVFSKYALVIRRTPKTTIVAALELLSPSNKGVGNRFDRDKYLRKRDGFLGASINFLEIDALTEGERLLPWSLRNLTAHQRNAWTALHRQGRRTLRGLGWNADEPLPILPWQVEEQLEVVIELPTAMADAREFNRWNELV